jgi:LysR family transcriptional regulator, hca operon transcriptional activator
LIRGPRRIELTPAGRAFLDHARVALSQVEVAGEAARRAAQIAKESFAIGFLTGHEVTWLSEALRILHDDQPNIEVIVHSHLSPDLARGLLQGKLDAAFFRREDQMTGLA